MAVFATLCFAPSFTFSANQTHNPAILSHHHILGRGSTTIRTKRLALGNDSLGDFGARDPFPAEIETNFCDKVGVYDTEHKILIPTVAAMSLSQQECTPISHLRFPIPEEDAQKLLRKVIGWRLVNEDGKLKLQCLWKLRDFECGVELINRIFKAVGSTGHFPNLHLEQSNQVRAELWTSSIGGLSMNDFIVAAKIDDIRTSDLVPRKRAWA
ncbi:probable pterin-4-alpha-carbinolamine dehydratase, chloroplastic [Cynara cardunculus var. scolymus]|uniref:4a-hydroxytetrahydrobiopterin dehydratase n=1 Tax=Cynara cardunculus var. scolymus TaxID=59895 RepID=A0A103YJ38_CYNCS|nr:probable pterin-4-alpha-carbinolamine dehydratase, chloroplastic [Cynara cardunculus var. scolymus]KVI10034.1 Transcriptional coactivator/pterin dehydratase [Cynara cardunculus var. scolymus]